MANPYILQIETATQVCSVALSAGGKTIAFRDIDEPNVHAARLTLLVEELLQATDLTFKDLSAVAVSKGPGSYTGLRIGVSAAKGLCYATDLPLIGIDTLAGMATGFLAENAISENTLLYPMIDARRMEVYVASYDQHGQAVSPPEAMIVDAGSFDQQTTNHQIILFGSGADKLAEMFAGNPQIEVATRFRNSARHLSQLADRAYREKEFEDVAYFEPYYLKDFIATTPKTSPG